jgi:hypothetical protein
MTDRIFSPIITCRVEVPTERDPIGRQVLETFLESEFSSENIRFWLAIQDLKYCPTVLVNDKVEHIFECAQLLDNIETFCPFFPENFSLPVHHVK